MDVSLLALYKRLLKSGRGSVQQALCFQSENPNDEKDKAEGLWPMTTAEDGVSPFESLNVVYI